MAMQSADDNDDFEMRMAALRAAIDDGLTSGVADGDVFARLREKFGLKRWPEPGTPDHDTE
jgi:hypothetical protein